MTTDFQAFVHEQKKIIDKKIITYIEDLQAPNTLKQSMIYSLKAGGKRIRPLLLYAVLDAFQKDKCAGDACACTIEMIHTYSLIHDDLPAMDNDDYRRGMPTNHKVFGEDMAILAGDGLLTHSFTVLANDEQLSLETRLRLIQEISAAAGPIGMIAGQVLDMEAEGKRISMEALKQIHINKTGRLIVASLLSGAIIAGVSKEIQEEIRKFGMYVGLAFQIQDDILDEVGNEQELGKPVGSDSENDKSTYVSLTSVEDARKYLQATYQNALDVLASLQLTDTHLKDICDWIVDRTN